MAMTTTDRPPLATVASTGRVRERRAVASGLLWWSLAATTSLAVLLTHGGGAAAGARIRVLLAVVLAAHLGASNAPRVRHAITITLGVVALVTGVGFVPFVVKEPWSGTALATIVAVAAGVASDRGRHGRAAAASATLDPSPGHRPRRRAVGRRRLRHLPGDHGGERAPGRPRPGSRRCRVDRRGCRALHPRRRHPRRLVRGIAQPGGSRAVARLGIDALGRDRARRRARGRRLRCADGRRSRPRCQHR